MAHNIGNTIAELRKKKKWTQTELAQKLNISDKAVSKWENDGGLPSVEFFPRLADLFGVSIDYLMTGKEDSAHEEEEEEELSDSEYGVDEQFRHDVDELCVEELALIVQDQADLYGDEELRYIKHRPAQSEKRADPSAQSAETAGDSGAGRDLGQAAARAGKEEKLRGDKEKRVGRRGRRRGGLFCLRRSHSFPHYRYDLGRDALPRRRGKENAHRRYCGPRDRLRHHGHLEFDRSDEHDVNKTKCRALRGFLEGRPQVGAIFLLQEGRAHIFSQKD